jgi:hypothetical protein
MSGALVHYDAMCQAISAAHAVDEVKDIRDKALAIQIYARQARNVDAEGKACEIRLRAERRVGQLLKETQKAKGSAQPGVGRKGVSAMPSQATTPLSELGISRDQSSRWQKLAAIPDDDFERTFAGTGKKPSTAGIIAANSPPPEKKVSPIDPRAVWLWGRLLDFERQNVLSADPAELFGTMIDHMKVTTRELAPLVAAWLERLPK